MNRRALVKQVLATFVAPKVLAEQGSYEDRRDGTSWNSPTILVQLVEGQPGTTGVLLTEHGDADYVIVEAFYWTMVNNLRVMFHKEATAPVAKGTTSMTELPMVMADIVFIKVKEMKLLNQSAFGKVPHGS